MKGTIDQLDAFISGVSSAWARALVFLGSLCLGHLLGMFASDFAWIDGKLHSGFDILLVPTPHSPGCGHS